MNSAQSSPLAFWIGLLIIGVTTPFLLSPKSPPTPHSRESKRQSKASTSKPRPPVDVVPTAPRYFTDLSNAVGKVAFTATGTSGLKIVGRGDHPEGRLSYTPGIGVVGELHVDLNHLDTGIALQNNRMKEDYLEVSEFPEAILTLDPWKVPLPAENNFETKSFPFYGRLFLHGITKPVKGSAHVFKNDDTIGAAAEFKIKMSDFEIAQPRFAGISISDEIEIEVDFEMPMPRASSP